MKFLAIFVEKFYVIDIQSILLYVLTHNTNKPLIHFDHCSTVQNVKADFYSMLSYFQQQPLASLENTTIKKVFLCLFCTKFASF